MNASTPHSSTTARLIRSCSASCQKLLNRIQSTKKALLAEFRDTVDAQDRMLHLALNEAEALARDTGFPLLTFPTLAREKAEALAAWKARQRAIRRSTLHSVYRLRSA